MRRGGFVNTHYVTPAACKDRHTTWRFHEDDRRHFLSAAAAGILASSARGAETVNECYRKLDTILQSPVLKKKLFKTPVVIDSVELFRLNNGYVCGVRSNRTLKKSAGP